MRLCIIWFLHPSSASDLWFLVQDPSRAMSMCGLWFSVSVSMLLFMCWCVCMFVHSGPLLSPMCPYRKSLLLCMDTSLHTDNEDVRISRSICYDTQTYAHTHIHIHKQTDLHPHTETEILSSCIRARIHILGIGFLQSFTLMCIEWWKKYVNERREMPLWLETIA